MRRVPLSLVLAALLIHSALLVFINLAFGADIIGLNTLTANLMFCLLVGGVVLGRSDLRLRDVGLQRQHLATGVGFLGWVLFGSSIVLMAASALLPGLWLVFDWARLEPYRLAISPHQSPVRHCPLRRSLFSRVCVRATVLSCA